MDRTAANESSKRRFDRTLRHSPRAAGSLLCMLVAFTFFGPATPATATDPNHVRLTLTRFGVVGAPTGLAFPNDSTGRVFALEQKGVVRVRAAGGFLAKPYLDIHTRVRSGGEQGLLGMAFHPTFKTSGVFYLSYTDSNGALRVSRFRATPSANVASTTEFVVLTVPHPTNTNHNGGQLAFGPDGYLYIGTGDGGSGGDPPANAQNINQLLGKILRIDVTHSCGSLRYCIPPSNPFASSSGRRKEIWHYGLRNPWKFSFDRSGGNLWVGDVGQDAREEVDLIGKGISARNMGWDCREGSLNTASQYGGAYCSGKTFMPPLFEYGHASGRCAIIGGYAYGGSTFRAVMGGMYMYADYCTGEIWGLAKQSNGSYVNSLVYNHPNPVTTFGETPTGEIFMADANGNIYRINGASR